MCQYKKAVDEKSRRPEQAGTAMTFTPGFRAPTGKNRMNAGSLWFAFNQGRLLVKKSAAGYDIPDREEIAAFLPASCRHFYFGELDGCSCYAACMGYEGVLTAPLEWIDPRMLSGAACEELFWVAGRANQLVAWEMSHHFCGRCGGPTRDKTDERAKTCPGCGLVNYPRLSPAVIMAVLKDDCILLARNNRFRAPMFSVLAGFVEPGETLEECVEREIREEVGITVKHIRYFGSQPWPFPDSLMIGFVAEYADGEIAVDGNEIAEAAWFSRNDLPPIPPSISIARRLIDWFVSGAEINGRFHHRE